MTAGGSDFELSETAIGFFERDLSFKLRMSEIEIMDDPELDLCTLGRTDRHIFIMPSSFNDRLIDGVKRYFQSEFEHEFIIFAHFDIQRKEHVILKHVVPVKQSCRRKDQIIFKNFRNDHSGGITGTFQMGRLPHALAVDPDILTVSGRRSAV